MPTFLVELDFVKHKFISGVGIRNARRSLKTALLCFLALTNSVATANTAFPGSIAFLPLSASTSTPTYANSTLISGVFQARGKNEAVLRAKKLVLQKIGCRARVRAGKKK